MSSVVDQVAAGLREAILDGARPPGTRLREVELARRCGRSPPSGW